MIVLYLRTMNLEHNATNDNVGEEERELPAVAAPQSGSNNATLEIFAQIMTAMTQMIKSSQNQASGNGRAPMDKYLKLFQDMKPPLFSGGGPIKAEN